MKDAAVLKNLHFQNVPAGDAKGFLDIPGGDQLHLILRVIFDPRKDNGPFQSAVDENRIASGTAKGRILRNNLHPGS